MSVNLQKGQKVDLTKGNAGLKRLVVGLGWDAAEPQKGFFGMKKTKNIDCDAVRELNLLEPFGEANRRPIFVYKNLKIDSIRALSDGKHLKMTVKDGNTIVNAIGFNMGQYTKEFMIGDKIDIARNFRN